MKLKFANVHALDGNVKIANRKLPKKVVVPMGILMVTLTTVIILYYTNPKARDYIDSMFNFAKKSVPTAPLVEFSLSPPKVKPNSQFTITGRFYDGTGKDVIVNEGFYYAFVKGDSGKFSLVTQGSLGKKKSKFSKSIPTANWIDGTYLIRIIDRPLSQDEIENPEASSPVLQAQQQSRIQTPNAARPRDASGIVIAGMPSMIPRVSTP